MGFTLYYCKIIILLQRIKFSIVRFRVTYDSLLSSLWKGCGYPSRVKVNLPLVSLKLKLPLMPPSVDATDMEMGYGVGLSPLFFCTWRDTF